MELKVIDMLEIEKEKLIKDNIKVVPDNFFMEFIATLESGRYLLIGHKNYILLNKTQSPVEDISHPSFNATPHFNYTRIMIPKCFLLIDEPITLSMHIEISCSCDSKPEVRVLNLREFFNSSREEVGKDEDEEEKEVVKN